MLGKSIIVAALFLVAFVSVTHAQVASGVFGLDISSGVSQTISQSGWSCLLTQGNYTFAIIEVRLLFINYLLFRSFYYLCPSYFLLCLIFSQRVGTEAMVKTTFCLPLWHALGQEGCNALTCTPSCAHAVLVTVLAECNPSSTIFDQTACALE